MQDLVTHETDRLRSREFPLPDNAPSTTRTAEEERQGKNAKLHSDYLIDALPSMGVSAGGMPMTAVGTNGYAESIPICLSLHRRLLTGVAEAI